MGVTYKVYIDWDATNWADAPDFSQAIDDVSSYVKDVRMIRGKEKELGNVPAATLELKLDNTDGRFSPTNSGSPLYGKVRPWLPVQIKITHDTIDYTKFTGFISRIGILPSRERQEAYLYMTDGLDLLARQQIKQDEEETESCSDGVAVGKVLDAAGWSSSKRSIDMDGGDITKYPACTEY